MVSLIYQLKKFLYFQCYNRLTGNKFTLGYEQIT